MGKRLVAGLLLCILAIFALVGCSTSTTDTNNNTSSTSNSDQTFTLVYAVPQPPTTPRVQADYAFMDYVEEQSGGRVKFERYPGGILCSGPEEVEFIKNGAIDLGCVLAHRGSDFPLHYLPLRSLPTTDDDMVSELGKLLNNENSETSAILKKEAEEQNTYFLGYRFWPKSGLSGIGSKTNFSSLAELKGQKIASISSEPAFEQLGITIVTYPVNTEIYEGLSRGVVDGVTYSLDGMVTMEFYENLSCYMNTPAADVLGAQGVYAMNLETWNSLPSDIQEIFNKGIEEVTYPKLAEAGESSDTTNIQFLKDAGLTVGDLSNEDIASLVTLRNELRQQEFISLCEKAGKSAEAQIIIQVCNDFIAQISGTN